MAIGLTRRFSGDDPGLRASPHGGDGGGGRRDIVVEPKTVSDDGGWRRARRTAGSSTIRLPRRATRRHRIAGAARPRRSVGIVDPIVAALRAGRRVQRCGAAIVEHSPERVRSRRNITVLAAGPDGDPRPKSDASATGVVGVHGDGDVDAHVEGAAARRPLAGQRLFGAPVGSVSPAGGRAAGGHRRRATRRPDRVEAEATLGRRALAAAIAWCLGGAARAGRGMLQCERGGRAVAAVI